MIVIHNCPLCKAVNVRCCLAVIPVKRYIVGRERIKNDDEHVLWFFLSQGMRIKYPGQPRSGEAQWQQARKFQEIASIESILHFFSPLIQVGLTPGNTKGTYGVPFIAFPRLDLSVFYRHSWLNHLSIRLVYLGELGFQF